MKTERGMGLCTELKVVNGDTASASIPTTTARIGQSFATRVLLGGEEMVRALKQQWGAYL